MAEDPKIEPEGVAKKKGFSRLFWAALLLGVAVHLAGFLVFRVVSNPLPQRTSEEPFVQFVSSARLTEDTQFEERAVLFDSAPLFLPTEWNAARNLNFQSSGYVPVGFDSFEPEISLLDDLNIRGAGGLAVAAVEEPMDLLSSRYWRFFKNFGEGAAPAYAFPDASLFAQVEWVSGDGLGASTAYEPVPVELETMPTAGLKAPAHFLVRLIGGGYLGGAPVLERSSGSSEFDQALARWLEVSTLVGGLAEGYYRVKIFSD